MPKPTVTLQIPENLYEQLANTANAVGDSLDEIMLQALTVGSPLLQKNKKEELTVVE
jgi:hypothetical protein